VDKTLKVEFRILGPVEVLRDGEPLPLGGPKQRAVLAVLLLNPNSVVSQETLIAALWGDDPPPTATKSLQVHVSRLRRELGFPDGSGPELVTRAPGYMLRVGSEALDLLRFEHLASEGRHALQRGDPERAAGDLQAALELWRGQPFADLALEPFALPAAARLEAQRITVTESWVEAELALGRHAELVGRLEELVRQHPYRERLRAQLILALYRSGRQADALASYREARAVLADELGIEPGPELRELERRVLDQDPSLALAPPAHVPAPEPSGEPQGSRPTGRRRRLLAASGVLVGALVAAGLATFAFGFAGGDAKTPPPIVGNTLVKVDPETDRVTDVIPVGRDPDRLVATADAVWVANSGDRTVSRVDTQTRKQRRIRGFPFVSSITADPIGHVYVSSFKKLVSVIDPARLLVSPFARLPGNAEAVAFGAGSLWVSSPSERRADGPNIVAQIDPDTGAVVRRIGVGLTPIFAVYGYGRVWASNYDSDTVSVIEPGSAQAETVAAGGGPLGITTGEGAVWVVAYRDRQLVRIDPETKVVTARIPIGNGPLDVAVGDGAVWVTNREDGTLLHIDPATDEVVATIQLGLAPHGVIVSGGAVWVTVRSSAYG
jgi:YVTN family beta-propeller protein